MNRSCVFNCQDLFHSFHKLKSLCHGIKPWEGCISSKHRFSDLQNQHLWITVTACLSLSHNSVHRVFFVTRKWGVIINQNNGKIEIFKCLPSPRHSSRTGRMANERPMPSPRPADTSTCAEAQSNARWLRIKTEVLKPHVGILIKSSFEIQEWGIVSF